MIQANTNIDPRPHAYEQASRKIFQLRLRARSGECVWKFRRDVKVNHKQCVKVLDASRVF